MFIKVNDTILKAELVDNSSTKALKKKLAQGPLTIHMNDYARMEKVGDLGFYLPVNDRYTQTEAKDLILYQGHFLVIYYAPNYWNFTKLGRIENVSKEELKKLLGHQDVTVTLSLE